KLDEMGSLIRRPVIGFGGVEYDFAVNEAARQGHFLGRRFIEEELSVAVHLDNMARIRCEPDIGKKTGLGGVLYENILPLALEICNADSPGADHSREKIAIEK